MKSPLHWQLYVAAYTFLFGLPLLVTPDFVLPLLGFDPTPGPWVRLVGMLLLSLSVVSYGIYREKVANLVPYSIGVRAFIMVVLLALAIVGHPPFLYVMCAIVGLGVAGSIYTYVRLKTPML